MKTLLTTLLFTFFCLIQANAQNPSIRASIIDKFGDPVEKIPPYPPGRYGMAKEIFEILEYQESTNIFIDEVINSYKKQFPQLNSNFWNKAKQEIDYTIASGNIIQAFAIDPLVDSRLRFIKEYNITSNVDVFYNEKFNGVQSKKLNEKLYQIGRKLGGYLNTKIIGLITEELN